MADMHFLSLSPFGENGPDNLAFHMLLYRSTTCKLYPVRNLKDMLNLFLRK